MDDPEWMRKIERELGALDATLRDMPNNDAMRAVRTEFAQADMHGLREMATMISNMRADVKDWISASRDENTAKLALAKADIMEAISQRGGRGGIGPVSGGVGGTALATAIWAILYYTGVIPHG